MKNQKAIGPGPIEENSDRSSASNRQSSPKILQIMDLKMQTPEMMLNTMEVTPTPAKKQSNKLVRHKTKNFAKKSIKIDKLQSVEIEPIETDEKTDEEIVIQR